VADRILGLGEKRDKNMQELYGSIKRPKLQIMGIEGEEVQSKG
jgi:hypothetical protein